LNFLQSSAKYRWKIY